MYYKKLFSEWKWIAALLLLIIILGLLLRVLNITSVPIFADEAIYIRWAQVMKNESSLRFLPLTDGKQPLFMWSIIPFLKIFNDPLVAGRAVSVLTGMGSLVGVFVFTHLLFENKKVSLFAALIYSVTPFAVFFDRMALVDSMLTMFGVWVFVFALLTVRHRRIDTAILTGFALGGALLTKSPALFFVLLLPLVGIMGKWPRNRKVFSLRIFQLGGLLGIAWGIGYAMFNILRLGPNFHLLSSRNYDYVFPISHLWESPKDPFLPHFDRAIEWISIFGPILLIVLLIMGIISGISKYRKESLFLLAWAFGPIMVQAEFAKVFTARYILFSTPALYVLAGLSLLTLSMFLSKKVSSYVIGLLIVLFLGSAIWFDLKIITDPQAAPLPRSERAGYLEEWTAGTGIREVADFILAEHDSEPNVPIVVGTEGFFGTLPDGLQAYLEGVPNVLVIGAGLDINEIPSSLLESNDAGNKTYLAANSSRLNFDDFRACKDRPGYFIKDLKCEKNIIERNGFKVVLAVEKATRPENIREYTHFGPNDTFYLLKVK